MNSVSLTEEDKALAELRTESEGDLSKLDFRPRISLALPSFALLQFWSQVSLKQAWLRLQQ